MCHFGALFSDIATLGRNTGAPTNLNTAIQERVAAPRWRH